MDNEENSKIIDTVRDEKIRILRKKLKEQIEKIGYTQEKVAGKIGVSPSSISKYLSGKGFPDQITLEALAKLFGVTPNYLIGQSECPTYTFEDITEKTGLSQKAIEKLYQLQHDYFLFEDNIEIDIQEKRKISKQYKEHIDILNSILENDVYLFWLLDSIRKYKLKNEELDNAQDIIKKFDIKEELATQEDRIQRRLLELVKEIIKKEQ